MTLDEFFDRLAAAAPDFDWAVGDGRSVRGAFRGGCDCCRGGFCPVTAVARHDRKVAFPDDLVLSAAEAIGLAGEDAAAVLAAADGPAGDADVRRRLLCAVGVADGS